MERKVLMKLDRVTKTYDMGEVKVEALKETTLEIYKGEMLVILGPSGSGKSTLLNLMGGMDSPTSGKVIFDGKDITSGGEDVLTHYRRNEVGFVFQFYNLIPDLTARENVELAAALVKTPLLIDDILKEVGLNERMDHFPSQMSGGEQQRISIARAVIKNPRLLLCDEPTGALDYETGKLILSLLKKINDEKGCTVVLITHNIAIGGMGDRVARMRSGEIVEVTENPNPISPEGIEW
ncbi:MAG: ABC transporter ATP-binding protein [Syntrophomonadaceae bacterium]|nr:ABC transporter ATP-binding protein [Syntrophomonadaceae bacterium]